MSRETTLRSAEAEAGIRSVDQSWAWTSGRSFLGVSDDEASAKRAEIREKGDSLVIAPPSRDLPEAVNKVNDSGSGRARFNVRAP